MFKSLSSLLNYDNSSGSSGRQSYKRARSSHSEVFDFIQLIRTWPTLIGKGMAKNTLPLKIESKELIILTKHSAVSQELSFMEKVIKQKIFDAFPPLKQSIKRIRFQCNPSFFEITSRKQKSLKEKSVESTTDQTPKLHPYSPEYQQFKREAEKNLEHISDSDLKETLISIYIQNKLDKR